MKQSGKMFIEYTAKCPGDYFAELCGDWCKVWKGEGLPVYEGTIEGLAVDHPEFLGELIARRIVRPTK